MVEALGFWVLSLFPEMGFVCSFRSNSLPYDLFTHVYNLLCVYGCVSGLSNHSLAHESWLIRGSVWQKRVSDRREWAHYKQLYKRLYHCGVCAHFSSVSFLCALLVALVLLFSSFTTRHISLLDTCEMRVCDPLHYFLSLPPSYLSLPFLSLYIFIRHILLWLHSFMSVEKWKEGEELRKAQKPRR